MSPRRFITAAAVVLTGMALQGCLAVAAGGAVVGATGAVVVGTAKAGGAVVGAVIPDGDVDCRKKKNRKKRECRED